MFYPEELSPRRKLMFSMWDAPNDGKVRAVVSFDATNLNAYIASLNQQSAATGLCRRRRHAYLHFAYLSCGMVRPTFWSPQCGPGGPP